jgi:hypothetical protein
LGRVIQEHDFDNAAPNARHAADAQIIGSFIINGPCAPLMPGVRRLMNMRRAFMRLILLCCIATASLVSFRSAAVAAQIRCAGIVGRATSIQGWVIPAATIRFINKAAKQSHTVETDVNGEYSACLGTGTYDVVATAPGYKAAKRKSIEVEAAGRNVVDFVMKQSGKANVGSLHP